MKCVKNLDEDFHQIENYVGHILAIYNFRLNFDFIAMNSFITVLALAVYPATIRKPECSSSTNGKAIKGHTPPPSSLMAHQNFFCLKKAENEFW